MNMKKIKKYSIFVNENSNFENMLKPIGNYIDTFLNVNYELVSTNAKELSDYLKENIKNRNLDIDYFNSDKSKESWQINKSDLDLEKNPPNEIYEYQPFFLMKKENGEYLLLDGFRRLLYYNTPEKQPIMVRIYDEKNLNNQTILKLLIYLNHFKFYGGSGEYFDRGFSLAFKILFDLDVPKIKNIMDGYLNYEKEEKGFSSDRPEKTTRNNNVKERILNPMFIDDMIFIQGLIENNVLLNANLGCLIYKKRVENQNIKFISSDFVKIYNENKNIEKIIKKYKRGGTYEREASNELVEEYNNIFGQILGGDVKVSYQDLLDKAKNLSTNLKKDSNWIKITGNREIHKIEKQMEDFVDSTKTSPKFKVVVYPNKNEYDITAVGEWDARIKNYKVVRSAFSDVKNPVIVLKKAEYYMISTKRVRNYYSESDYKQMYRNGDSGEDKTFDGYYYKVDVFVSFV